MATLTWKLGSYTFENSPMNRDSFELFFPSRLGEQFPPRKDGSIISSAPKRDSLSFSYRSFLYATTPTSLRTKLDSLASVLEGGKQNFYMWNDRYIKVTKENFNYWFVPGSGGFLVDFIIQFKVDDPFWESETASSGNYTTNATPSLSNTGNAPAWTTFTITAPVGGLTAVTLTNSTTTKTFSWTGSLTSGQTLVVNMQEQTIEENGVEDMSGLGTSAEFWSLSSGDNTLSISSTTTGATVSVSWRDRWF